MVKLILVTLICSQLQAQDTDSKDKIYHAYSMVDGVSRLDPNRCFKLTSVPVAVSSAVSGAVRSYLYPVDCSTGKPIIDLASVESRLIRLESETLNNTDTIKLVSEIISTYRLSVEMLINQSQELARRVQALEAKLAAGKRD